MASGAGLGDGSIVPVEGTSLYGVVRGWYGEILGNGSW